MSVLLVGLMASGKSSLAKALAETLGTPWQALDLDALIESEAQCSIPDIFTREGEAGFRKRERAALHRYAQAGQHHIIATGGGCAAQPGAMDWMREAGLVVWLKAPVDVLWSRAQAQGLHLRPMLQGSDTEALARLESLGIQRTPFYEQAHLHVDAREPLAVLVKVIKAALEGSARPLQTSPKE